MLKAISKNIGARRNVLRRERSYLDGESALGELLSIPVQLNFSVGVSPYCPPGSFLQLTTNVRVVMPTQKVDRQTAVSPWPNMRLTSYDSTDFSLNGEIHQEFVSHCKTVDGAALMYLAVLWSTVGNQQTSPVDSKFATGVISRRQGDDFTVRDGRGTANLFMLFSAAMAPATGVVMAMIEHGATFEVRAAAGIQARGSVSVAAWEGHEDCFDGGDWVECLTAPIISDGTLSACVRDPMITILPSGVLEYRVQHYAELTRAPQVTYICEGGAVAGPVPESHKAHQLSIARFAQRGGAAPQAAAPQQPKVDPPRENQAAPQQPQ